MAKPDPERLREIRDLNSLLDYFEEELDWPLRGRDLEDIAYDWEPEELGIDPDRLPHLERLRQLPPLDTHQPWGIFFLEFEGGRLPITPMRLLLQALVRKRPGNHPTWDLRDLLFVITTTSGEAIELHLVAFFKDDADKVEIRSLPWRPRESPTRHLRRLDEELLPNLRWPEGEEDEVEQWRDAWRVAFKLRHGEAIKTASQLAERMAGVAMHLRELITEEMQREKKRAGGERPLTELLETVKRELVAGVEAPKFADMCAQTVVYGLLTARITDPDGFGAAPTLSVIPLSNPFLASFFEMVHDLVIELDPDDAELDSLVADLRASEVEAVLDHFGATNKGGDPVIHFYEEFLARYDNKMRLDSGAVYTPQPVVSFMVRTVDEILRTRFGLEQGIADSATWAEVAERLEVEVPEGVRPGSQFVSMLDPATGTGTFLVEWLKQARRSFGAERPDSEWLEHLRGSVLPSMHAFEFMLAPYAIAHLKVALELHDSGLDEPELQILLTDTLDHTPPALQFDVMRDPVAVEGEIAAELKQGARFTTIIGNPPYDREVKAAGDEGRRKGGIVRHGAPGISPLIRDVTSELRDLGLAKHALSVYNDYVYFWRWSLWQVTERKPGPGVVALITASSFVDGVSMAGLRSLMRTRFDHLTVVDLGGDSRGESGDENVFDIRTPVAICFAVKTGAGDTDECSVRYLSIRGTRRDKFERLEVLSLHDPDMIAVEGSRGDPLSPHKEPTAGTPSGVALTDAFPWSARGIQFSRTWPVASSKEVLRRRWKALLDAPRPKRPALLKETRDVRADGVYKSFRSGEGLPRIAGLQADAEPDALCEIMFRSFDRQFCIADRRVIDMPRPALWRSARSNQQVFLVSIPDQGLGPGPVLVAGTGVPDLNAFNNRGGLVLPMMRVTANGRPSFNLASALMDRLEREYGTPPNPTDVVSYFYGILGSPAFFAKFGDTLAHGNLVVPITADSRLFVRAARLGKRLLWLHTFGTRFSDGRDLPEPSASEKQPISHYPETFDWEQESSSLIVGDGVIGPVSREVWAFEVSGLKPLQSWLGYRMKVRKGRKSSPLDEIRPKRWTFTAELLSLLAILEQTVEVTPEAATLLEEIVKGPLIDPADIPQPAEAERKPPKG